MMSFSTLLMHVYVMTVALIYLVILNPNSFPTGEFWKGCNDIWAQEIREYISEPWNLLDFSILATFMTSFIARLMAFWHAYSAQCYVNKHYSDLANVKLPFEIQYFQLGKFASSTNM